MKIGEETDSGNSLRLNISKKMYKLYNSKITQYMSLLHAIEDETDPKYKQFSDIINKLTEISEKLRTTTSKNNIMREARDFLR